MARERILIIEDEQLIRLSLRARLEKEGYVVEEAPDGRTGLQRLEASEIDLVLLDYRLPDTDGLTILKRVVVEWPDAVVILMTAYSTIESVVEAMRLGAFAYLEKPFNMDAMVVNVQKGLETTRLRREVNRFRREQAFADGSLAIIGDSPEMRGILEIVKKVNATGNSTVLLMGESGTGKDLLAKVIHRTSERASGPFMNITCTALPDTLLESELFGHERGAFTDAKMKREGLLQLAHGGTLFLDEVGDMPITLQSKLLRFLEDRSFRRLGASEDTRVDVRVICATNRDLSALVQSGQFRSDLYWRISVVPIRIPALRERASDIPRLCHYFVDRLNREFRKSVKGITPAALEKLTTYAWPGNVRELRNVIERAMILGSGDTLDVADLPAEIRGLAAEGAPREPVTLPPDGLDFEEVEKSLVTQAMRLAGGNQTRAARLLRMTRDQIRYRIEKFRLAAPAEDA